MSVDLSTLPWEDFDVRNARELAYSGGSVYARFGSGAVYRYDGVPSSVWDKLMSSGGSGSAFVSLVRSRYPSSLVV